MAKYIKFSDTGYSKKNTFTEEEIKSISSRECYDYYRKNRKSVSKAIDQYKYFEKTIGALTNVIANLLIDGERGGGVYIEGLGYFANLAKVETKQAKRYGIMRYRPYFFGEFGRSAFHSWYIHKTIIRRGMKKAITKNVKNGITYSLCYTHLKNLTGATRETMYQKRNRKLK